MEEVKDREARMERIAKGLYPLLCANLARMWSWEELPSVHRENIVLAVSSVLASEEA